MLPTVMILLALCGQNAGQGDRGFVEVPLVNASYTVVFEPLFPNSFQVLSHRVWASALGTYALLPSECGCGGENLWATGEAFADATFASASFYLFPCNATGVRAYCESKFEQVSANLIIWNGLKDASWIPGPQGSGCFSSQATALNVGFQVLFEASSSFSLPAPPCPPTVTRESSRVTTASFFCSTEGTLGPVAYSISHAGSVHNSCPVSASVLGPGVYDISFGSVLIDDSHHDVTGDGRFNQEDVDFLRSIVGTPAAFDPIYTSRFDFDDYFPALGLGEVDDGDVDILQCFVDSGLSAGIFGDADGDGVLSCGDLFLVSTYAFDGEMFPSTDYNVRLDVNLDGVLDAEDKAALRDVLLAVEPANFHLDFQINFFDYSIFLALHNSQDPLADLASPYGVFDFFDVAAFISAYNNPQCVGR